MRESTTESEERGALLLYFNIMTNGGNTDEFDRDR